MGQTCRVGEGLLARWGAGLGLETTAVTARAMAEWVERGWRRGGCGGSCRAWTWGRVWGRGGPLQLCYAGHTSGCPWCRSCPAVVSRKPNECICLVVGCFRGKAAARCPPSSAHPLPTQGCPCVRKEPSSCASLAGMLPHGLPRPEGRRGSGCRSRARGHQRKRRLKGREGRGEPGEGARTVTRLLNLFSGALVFRARAWRRAWGLQLRVSPAADGGTAWPPEVRFASDTALHGSELV